jgi:hypothetical protein
MALDFGNVRTVEGTIDRMVLSVMQPKHRDAYISSCYGYVCHALRTGEEFYPNDEIVLLGVEAGDGVIHSVLMRGDTFITDACSDDAILNGNVYIAPSTIGAEPIRMHVKGRISMQDFGEQCMARYLPHINPSQLIPENT